MFCIATNQSSNDGAGRRSALSTKYEYFARPDVQDLLKKITAIDPKTTLPDYTSLKRPREITLMTEEQLREVCPAHLFVNHVICT